MVMYLGLEHEFVVSDNGRTIDFRSFLRAGAVIGLAVDPGDRYAIRTPSGLVITADGAEAEYACPPVLAEPGFGDVLNHWAAHGGYLLQQAVGDQRSLVGMSTHLSVSVPPNRVHAIAAQFAKTFAPALMLMTESSESLGLLIRPRHDRLEFGLDYVAGSLLSATAAMALGGVQALLRGDCRVDELVVDIVAATDRFGWYVDRTAFGCDLYVEGRDAQLTTTAVADETTGANTTVCAQDHLERCWKEAKDGLLGLGGPDDLAYADDMISGLRSLPYKTTHGRTATYSTTAPPTVEAGLTEPIVRPSFTATVAVATWAHTVFQLEGVRGAYVAVPRENLGQYASDLRAGTLDRTVNRVLRSRDRNRGLGRFEHATAKVAYYDRLSGWESLAPPEPHRDGVMRLAPSLSEGPTPATPSTGSVGGTQTRDGGGESVGGTTGPTITTGGGEDPPARPLKFLPPIEEPHEEEIIIGFRWWPIIIALVSIITIIGIISLLNGNEGDPFVSLPPSPSPVIELTPPVIELTPPPIEVIEVPPHYDALFEVLLDIGFDEEEAELIIDLMLEDEMSDLIFSISLELAGNPGDDVDIWDVLIALFELDQARADLLFNNSVFECDETADDITTVCSQHGVLEVPAGQIVMIVQTLSGPVADDGWVYTYSAVVDSDGDPANNWVPRDPFDWDIYQGTDTWYTLDYSAGAWTGSTYGGSFDNPMPSSFRAVISNNTIVWFIAANEMPNLAGGQTTAFRHDGTFAPEHSAADVYGADPTSPLITPIDLGITVDGDTD